ncbi:hypothetical protein [Natronococcus jeotgali]|uniref:Uncharacterized protein n=1 Tax=Natronococcus jeotgali DSM 18795 TaxID=1227498 RepID=L9XKN9_9EURY|nr:hypothetical protein [Natronococcus jeotgali]ELY62310.1 hypothetical protein C492_08315 [Natronococcus jeotgali DSM 18795]
MAKRDWKFVVCLEVAKGIRVRICRTASLGTKIIRVDFGNFAYHAMILGIGIICTKIDLYQITD